MVRASLLCATLLSAGLAGPVIAAEPDAVARGEYLAYAGGCAQCHSAPGGKPYAGGLAINTPFGAIYSPNITPDKATGIGAWSDDEFYRAMHEGIGKGGEHLYPAFPYQWYTKVTREDVQDLRAYLSSLPAVTAKTPANSMMFPFNIRAGMAGWNAAFFQPGTFKPDPRRPAEWNRGAYLVEGLGHCGDCHTPKGVAKEPISSKAFSGGAIDNWYAPNISSNVAEGVGGWSDNDLVQYLKTGTAPGKGVVNGPMAEVVHDELAHLTDADVHAMVSYLKGTQPIASYADRQPVQSAGVAPIGAASYLNHCASCHQLDGKGLVNAIPALDGSGIVRAKGPEDVIRMVLGGHLATGPYAPMPAVGADMTDTEVAEAVNYVRSSWSNGAPATAGAGQVATIRASTSSLLAVQAAAATNADACQGGDGLPVPAIADPHQEIARDLTSVTDESMPEAAARAVDLARHQAPQAAQADIVNGLTVAYCHSLQEGAGGLADTDRRRRLNRFSQLVYTQFVAPSAY